jgi:SAM-dependent methyltransferase
LSLLTPERVETEELLDEENAPHDEMLRSLRDLRRINKYLGGRSIYRRMIGLMAPSRAPLSILDLGTGTSDLLADISRKRPVRAIGLDFKIEHLLYGSRLGRDGVMKVQADAFRLPFRSSSIDVVTSSHFFHHFSDEENGSMFGEALRVAKVGVAINDTRRHRVPLLLVKLLATLRLVGPITRFDAPASVLRGYTTVEAKKLADGIPASRARVVSLFPFRFGILLWK